MIEELRATNGDTFDSRCFAQQAAAHQEALALHRNYATSGANEALRAFTAKTAPVVEQHLVHVRQLSPG